jgi:hypothetical protein
MNNKKNYLSSDSTDQRAFRKNRLPVGGEINPLPQQTNKDILNNAVGYGTLTDAYLVADATEIYFAGLGEKVIFSRDPQLFQPIFGTLHLASPTVNTTKNMLDKLKLLSGFNCPTRDNFDDAGVYIFSENFSEKILNVGKSEKSEKSTTSTKWRIINKACGSKWRALESGFKLNDFQNRQNVDQTALAVITEAAFEITIFRLLKAPPAVTNPCKILESAILAWIKEKCGCLPPFNHNAGNHPQVARILAVAKNLEIQQQIACDS